MNDNSPAWVQGNYYVLQLTRVYPFCADGSGLFNNDITFQTSSLHPWNLEWVWMPKRESAFPETGSSVGENHHAGSWRQNELLVLAAAVCPWWIRLAVTASLSRFNCGPAAEGGTKAVLMPPLKAGPWVRIRGLACQLLSSQTQQHSSPMSN